MYIERKAVKGPRIGAAVIDWIFYSIIAGIISVVIQLLIYTSVNSGDEISTLALVASYLIGLVIPLLYFTIIPLLTKGKTLAKLMVGVKVVSSEFKQPSFLQLLLRNVYFLNVLILDGIVLGLNIAMSNSTAIIGAIIFGLIKYIIYIIIFIMILATPEERGVHDMIAGTYVVSKDFDLNELNNVNVLERQGMEWAEFDDDVTNEIEEDEIDLLGQNTEDDDDDEIGLLKNNDE